MTDIQPTYSGASALDRNLSARQLSTAHVTRVQNLERTPRWLHRLLPWVNVGGGVFRVNRRRIISSRFAGVVFSGQGNSIAPTSESLSFFPGFSGQDLEDIQVISKAFKSQKLSAGKEFSIEDGSLLIVVNGQVQQKATTPEGRQVRNLFLTAGQSGIVQHNAHYGPLIATGDTTVVTLSPTLAEKYPWLTDAFEQINREGRASAGVNKYGESAIQVLSSVDGEPKLPTTFVDYQDHPREYYLHSLQTVLRTHTRITDLYSNEFDQLREQVRVVIDVIREREEWELLNNPEFGLLRETAIAQRLPTRNGPPTPDDLDELLTKVWKKPGFFLAHPKAIAAFGREATRRGVPPPTVTLFGSPFLTWRGIPLVPSDKIPVSEFGETSILLLRVGEEEQGVIGLHNTGITGEVEPGLSVRYSGTDQFSVASHLITRYFSAAVLVEDAIARLDNVLIGNYYDYAP
ncbi:MULTISPECIES: family 2B encapsulin nanocompartment shell protein [Acetobacter]|uniref:Cyclic nucleotide-binding protein n=2 Tax=Acetobacter TaxID=434 RepID=A0AAN1PGE7_9PROT|nr:MULTISPECIES: family 2B encapsulin nanocompartment shell protein [Acetobacter]ASL40881.1 cyclic nucleotide-binding protein [Acetobacter oryzifermentans]AXM99773.1 cyclic nucleotide-binding protein [Acetobacter pomorum]KAA8393394.1 cyclic nucleotide-binding domain-containing protein [Acetobacter sp. DmW_125124]KAA8396878.1 cyclic nucleotide-binding domain-containing protein [Acetobacter sp. DmW_125127]KAA8400650.1 cyclic nucleotide-binding domain-containing protein [Acetobacter sp. DmW_12512